MDIVKKELLKKILVNYQDYAECIILYGSYSYASSLSPNSQSDFDILFVFKNFSNPYILSSELNSKLQESNIDCDYNWFVEKFFIEKIQNFEDLYFWKLVFFDGEIFFSNRRFIDNVRNIIKNTAITKSIPPTLQNRLLNIAADLKSWIRNLSRILTDQILSRYCIHHKIDFFIELPNHRELIEKSYNERIISNELFEIQNRLLKLSSLPIMFIESKRHEIIEELLLIENYLIKNENIKLEIDKNAL